MAQGPPTVWSTQALAALLQEQQASTQAAQKAQLDFQAETARLNAEVATLRNEVAKAIGLAERQKETIREQKDKIKASCSSLLPSGFKFFAALCRSNCSLVGACICLKEAMLTSPLPTGALHHATSLTLSLLLCKTCQPSLERLLTSF